jgi:hypothetical protein
VPELEGTTWHGLLANRVVELRRRGLTTLQIQDLVGMSLKMVERYCRFADKKANAEATIIQMEERRTERNRNAISWVVVTIFSPSTPRCDRRRVHKWRLTPLLAARGPRLPLPLAERARQAPTAMRPEPQPEDLRS